MQNDKIYYADIYLRVSKEEGEKRESIINQKELIFEFLRTKTDIQIYAVRADDGYSGVSFARVR